MCGSPPEDRRPVNHLDQDEKNLDQDEKIGLLEWLKFFVLLLPFIGIGLFATWVIGAFFLVQTDDLFSIGRGLQGPEFEPKNDFWSLPSFLYGVVVIGLLLLALAMLLVTSEVLAWLRRGRISRDAYDAKKNRELLAGIERNHLERQAEILRRQEARQRAIESRLAIVKVQYLESRLSKVHDDSKYQDAYEELRMHARSDLDRNQPSHKYLFSFDHAGNLTDVLNTDY
jgi:hypothetical protein